MYVGCLQLYTIKFEDIILKYYSIICWYHPIMLIYAQWIINLKVFVVLEHNFQPNLLGSCLTDY